MSAIEIHIADAEAAARGTLFARVTTQEDGRLLGAWQLPYEGLGRGWYCLDLPEIDIGARQSALLWLLWLSRSGTPPRLSLSAVQPVPESRVQTIPTGDSDRSLALRLYVGLPGTRRVASPLQIRSQTSAPGRSVQDGIHLAPSVLHGFVELRASTKGEPLASLNGEKDALELRASRAGEQTMTTQAEAATARGRAPQRIKCTLSLLKP
jgi:hypothetical protein